MSIVGSSEVNRFNPRPLSNLSGGRGFGIRYPSPFFDVAQQFLPENVHQLHLWCRYYFFTNPLINVACSKMAEYPVTNIIFDTEDPEIQKRDRALMSQLRLRQFQVEVGLDYFCYGNSFVSVWFKMIKFLVCEKCGERTQADKNRGTYKWKNMKFFLSCPKCKHEAYAKERDIHIRSVRDIKLVRWNPENIEIKHNEITGQSKYYYRLPRNVVNDIKIGDPDTIESLPLEFLDAARGNKALLFDPDGIYHLKRPTIAQKDQGWGSPLIYPLLKDAFYLQVLKKAQESISLEHIVPLRVIYPGPSSGGNDTPYSSYNLTNWKQKIDAELNLWKRDHNYIPILPVQVGFQQWGGTAKALIMHHEFRFHSEQMLAGAGIPVEFIFGGLQWSGTNTSLRALENMFDGYNKQRHELVFDFILNKIAAFMGWPKIVGRFDRFKMADDLQRSMFYFQLNQAQKISDRRLMEEIGENFDLEEKRKTEELKLQLATQRKTQNATADIQGGVSLRTSRYQAKAMEIQTKAQAAVQADIQASMPQPMQPGAPGMDPNAAAGGQPGADPQQQPPADPSADPSAQGQPTPDQQAPADPSAAPQDVQNTKLPVSMQSPLQAGVMGVDLRLLAQKAASFLKTVREEQGEQAMYQELEKMQTSNPPLYRLVIQLLNDTGSKTDPLNALKAPAGAGTAQKDPSRTIG